MNYRTLKASKSNVIKYNFNNVTIHDMILTNLLNISNKVVKVSISILNSLLTSTNYVYDETTDTYRHYNDSYYFRDTTDLKLKASQRTFL